MKISFIGSNIDHDHAMPLTRYIPKDHLKLALSVIAIILIISSLFFVHDTMAHSAQEHRTDSHTVCLYHMDENMGTTLTDSSGNGNDGRIYGGTWIDGKFGEALSLDGDDYIEIPPRVISPTEGTIEVWIKPNNVTGRRHIIWVGEPNCDGWGPEQSLHISIIDGKIGTYFGSSATNGVVIALNSTTILTVGNWYHIIFIYVNGVSCRLYVNDVCEASVPLEGKVVATDRWTYVRIGRPGANIRYFDGIIDEVRISNVARDISEVNFVTPVLLGSLFVCFVFLFMQTNKKLSPSSIGTRHNGEKRQNWKLIVSLIFFSLLSLAYINAGGLMADEPVYISRALLIERDLRSVFSPFYEGPFLYFVYSFAIRIGTVLDVNELLATRASVALFSTAITLLIYKFGEKLVDAKVGFYAACLYMFEPVLFGWSRVAYLDIPSLFFALFSIYIVAFEENAFRKLSFAGIAFGLMVASKISYVLIYLPILFFMSFLLQRNECIDNQTVSAKPTFFSQLLCAVVQTIQIVLLGAIVYAIATPFLWEDPFTRIRFLYTLRLGSVAVTGWPVFFLGKVYYYQPIYFYLIITSVSLTPILLSLATVGFLSAVRKIRVNQTKFEALFLILWLLVPLIFESLMPTKLGIRYIFMIIPPLVLFGGKGLKMAEDGARVLSKQIPRVPENNGMNKISKFTSVATPYAVPFTMITLVVLSTFVWWPYPTLYYSPIAQLVAPPEQVVMVGGGEGLKEAAAFINSLPLKKGTIGFCMWYDYLMRPYLDGRFKLVFIGDDRFLREHLDYVVVYVNWVQRFGEHSAIWKIVRTRELVFTYSINDAWLVKIYKV